MRPTHNQSDSKKNKLNHSFINLQCRVSSPMNEGVPQLEIRSGSVDEKDHRRMIIVRKRKRIHRMSFSKFPVKWMSMVPCKRQTHVMYGCIITDLCTRVTFGFQLHFLIILIKYKYENKNKNKIYIYWPFQTLVRKTTLLKLNVLKC